MLRKLPVLLIVLLLGAAPAAADAQSATASAQPNQAGRGSELTLSGSGSSAGLGQAAPQGVTIALFKSFAVDLSAVEGRCTDVNSCPASSRAAHGTFQGHASFLATNQSFSGTIDGFLAAPTNGALADVIIRVTASGMTYTGRGQLVTVSDRSFGYELRFDPLPQQMLPPGVTGSIDSLTLTTGAARTISSNGGPKRRARQKPRKCRRHRRCRRGHVRRRGSKSHRATGVRHNLLTNPATCSGSWPLELRVRYSDHTDVRPLSVSCTP